MGSTRQNGSKLSGLPTNVDAERLVLGAILVDAVEFAAVERQLKVTDFA